MYSVEKETTRNNVERARNNPEFEKRQEIEHKLVPVNPEIVAFLYKEAGTPVKQIYLSEPDEEFSMRVRQVGVGENARYTSTIKSRGDIFEGALKRTEIDTPISAESFAYYEATSLPRVNKIRTEVAPGLTIDFYEDEQIPVVVEVEGSDSKERAQLIELMQELVGPLIDKSDDPSLTNEAIAHKQHQSENPEKIRKSPETLDQFAERMLRDMVAQYVTGKNQVVLTLNGLPGSGKTTVTNYIESRIVELFGEQLRPNVVSTDDYHFGKTALQARYGAPYTDWDAAHTYNTSELADDLARHAEGTPLIKRHFDFDTEEPAFDKELPHSPFVIVEGLYAGSKDLNDARDIHGVLPTGPATSVGRDSRRLVIDNRANRAFPTPEDRLRYDTEVVIPLFWEQETPRHKGFSASVRPMAERAFMLAQL